MFIVHPSGNNIEFMKFLSSFGMELFLVYSLTLEFIIFILLVENIKTRCPGINFQMYVCFASISEDVVV